MIIDSRLEFADALALTAGPGTQVVANTVTTGSIVRDLGNGEPVYFCVTVDTSIIGTTDATGTITYQLVTDSNTNLTTAPVVLASSSVLVTDTTATAANKSIAGSIPFLIALPQGANYKEFLGIKIVTATRAITAGKVNAFLTKDLAGSAIYPDALAAGQ